MKNFKNEIHAAILTAALITDKNSTELITIGNNLNMKIAAEQAEYIQKIIELKERNEKLLETLEESYTMLQGIATEEKHSLVYGLIEGTIDRCAKVEKCDCGSLDIHLIDNAYKCKDCGFSWKK